MALTYEGSNVTAAMDNAISDITAELPAINGELDPTYVSLTSTVIETEDGGVCILLILQLQISILPQKTNPQTLHQSSNLLECSNVF